MRMERTAELPGLDFAPADLYTIESLDELRAVATPLRLRIIDCLIDAPRTVKEVGDCLGIRSTKLYYHVGELEKVGLVRLVHTEIKSAIQVKYYRAVARYYFLSPAMLHADGDDRLTTSGAFLAALLERAAQDLRRAIADGAVDRYPKAVKVSRRALRTTPERAAAFQERVADLDRAFRALEDEAGDLVAQFAVALFPVGDG
jgi:DNA-binding transcriptional ArsR family regulator